jgi:hypothetical protein
LLYIQTVLCAWKYVTFQVLHLHLSLTMFNPMGTNTFQSQAEKKLYTSYHYLNMMSEIKLLGTAVMWLTCIHTTTGFAMNIYHVVSHLPQKSARKAP